MQWLKLPTTYLPDILHVAHLSARLKARGCRRFIFVSPKCASKREQAKCFLSSTRSGYRLWDMCFLLP